MFYPWCFFHLRSPTSLVQSPWNFADNGKLAEFYNASPEILGCSAGERSGQGIYPIPSRLWVWGSVISSPSGVWRRSPSRQPLMSFGHYIRNFVRFHACFSAFLNLTGKTNKTDPIQPLLPAIGLEGAPAPCAPVWIRPCLQSCIYIGFSLYANI